MESILIVTIPIEVAGGKGWKSCTQWSLPLRSTSFDHDNTPTQTHWCQQYICIYMYIYIAGSPVHRMGIEHLLGSYYGQRMRFWPLTCCKMAKMIMMIVNSGPFIHTMWPLLIQTQSLYCRPGPFNLKVRRSGSKGYVSQMAMSLQ